MTWRAQRDCGFLEYHARWGVSSILYFRLFRRMFPDKPFYAPKAIRKLDAALTRNSRVFEWGSGASTIWFANRVSELVSIEHDLDWVTRGRNRLENSSAMSARLVHVPTEDDTDYDWATDWEHYHVLGRAPRRPGFRKYMSAIDDYPDSYFDCIAIDGRERMGCLVHAIPKLSDEGILVIDDTARANYADAFRILSGWRKDIYNFGLLQTTLFFRQE